MFISNLRFIKNKTVIIFLILVIAIILGGDFANEAKYTAKNLQKCEKEKNQCEQVKSELEWKIKVNCPQLTVAPNPTSYLVTPTPKKKIDFPENEKWKIYSAKCQGFSKVAIYYPSSWKLSSYGEEMILVGNDDGSQSEGCFIQFGYPVAPSSSQVTYVPGLYATINIFTFPLVSPISSSPQKEYSIKTIDDLINYEPRVKSLITDFENFEESIKSVNRQIINNQEYLVIRNFNFSKNYSCDRLVTWVTLRGGRYYEINLDVWDAMNFDPFTVGRFLDIGEEFVRRLELR
ncbi:MAG: hypothetical protein ACPLKP_03085 [Microgenomates group bacterium]